MKDCELIQEFLGYLKSERHFSEYTITCYSGDLEQFCDFLVSHSTKAVDNGPEVTFSQHAVGIAVTARTNTKLRQLLLAVDANIIGTFLMYLKQNQYRQATIQRKLVALRSFYKFLVRRHWLVRNPVTRVRTPKQEKKLPKFLEYQQVQQLLGMPAMDSWPGALDRAILETLYSTGMRVSELVALDVDDVDFLNEVVHIRSKGKISRAVPIDSSTLHSIQHYMKFRNELIQNNGGLDNKVLFANKSGKPLDTRTIRRKMDKYLAMAGLDPSISPHTLRHSFAMRMLNKGVDLRSLRDLLGHQSLSATRIYTHLIVKKPEEV